MDPLHEKIASLCGELDVPVPPLTSGELIQLDIDDTAVRFFVPKGGDVVLSAKVLKVGEVLEETSEDADIFLTRNLRLHGARVKKLGLPFSLSIEPDDDELILWVGFDPVMISVPALMNLVERLMNEVEYRRSWLGITRSLR